MDEHVVERAAVFARIQARSGSATACHSATSAATSRSRRVCTCRDGPLRVVVVGLVAGDDVGAQPDHVREQVAHRPVRAGGHPQRPPAPAAGRTPARSRAAGPASTPRSRPRAHPTTRRASGAAPAPRSGGSARIRACAAGARGASCGLERGRGGSESRESALTEDAGPEPLACVPGRGVVSTPGAPAPSASTGSSRDRGRRA